MVKVPKSIKIISNITNIHCLDKTTRVSEFKSNILGGLNMATKVASLKKVKVPNMDELVHLSPMSVFHAVFQPKTEFKGEHSNTR
jgi:hypothetical protein